MENSQHDNLFRMRVFLIHVRDPQFYALPAAKRAANGNIRVMGFPPIGIMSLSAVVKRAGHECLMFDQANPETPNETIIEEIRKQRPDLVGLSFLSTTSYPHAKILARQIRASAPRVRLAFGGVFATLNAERVKRQCPEVDFVCRGDGEQLLLDLLERLGSARAFPRVVRVVTSLNFSIASMVSMRAAARRSSNSWSETPDPLPALRGWLGSSLTLTGVNAD